MPTTTPPLSAATEREIHAVRMSDRLWDAAALLLILAGTTLFFLARHALEALAAGSYSVPKGVSYVTRADLHSEQSRLGLMIVGAGVLLGLISAVRHLRARSLE
jgi:hypothetical protein